MYQPILRLAAMLAVVIVMAAVATPTIHAQQVDDSLPPRADLTIASQYHSLSNGIWVVTVKNNTVGVHPGMHVNLVKVRVTISDPVGGDRPHIWTIGDLPVGGSASRQWRFLQPPQPATSASEEVPQRLYAEIIESEPAEPETPRFQFNNDTEHWGILKRSRVNPQRWTGHPTNGDAGVEIASISDRVPRAGGATTFKVHVKNDSRTIIDGDRARSDQVHTQFDVQVEISLSPGLAFAAGQEAPSGTTFDSTTGIWNVGTLGHRASNDLPVAINLTADSLADLPLEDRCLTAKVVRAVPWFHSQPFKRQNDTATACLGKVLLSSGELDLVTFYPCIGVTSHPCNNADTLELVVKWGDEYLQPEAILFHVPDPGGQSSKFGSLIWTTDRMMDLRDSQDKLTSSWEIKESVKVTAPGGGDAPGRWLLTNTDDTVDGNYDLLDAMDSATVTYDFYDLSDTGTNPTEYYLDVKVDFWALGTYKALFGISGRLSGATYTDSGTYTFHVGPISDLEAEAAWARPGVFTVTARNNGPDLAMTAQVRVSLPTGMRFLRAEAGVGSYDPGSGVWDIGRLFLAEHATLIVYTEPTGEAVTEPVTASIENTQDYCVRRGRGAAPDLECTGSLPAGYTEHSTAYYDHRLGNNVARLAARSTAPISATTRVTGMSVTSSPDPAKGYYLPGQELEVEATFSDTVTATAGARLRLQVGRSLREATVVPSTGEAIRFRYRVQWDDRTDPGEGISVPPYPFAGTEALKAAGGRTLWLAFPGQDLGSGHTIGPQPDRVPDTNVPMWSDPVFLATGQEGARYRFIDGMRHYYTFDPVTRRWELDFRIADANLRADYLDLVQWLALRASGYYEAHPYGDDADPVAGRPYLGRWEGLDHRGNQVCWGLNAQFIQGKTREQRLQELGSVKVDRLLWGLFDWEISGGSRVSDLLDFAHSIAPETCPPVPQTTQASPAPEGAAVMGIEMHSVGPYSAGSAIAVTVIFDREVEVSGAPQLAIEVGGESRTAVYDADLSGTRAKVFRYTVREADRDSDGVSVYSGSIALPPGASIRDAQGADADLTIAGLPPQPGHTVDGSQEGQSAQQQQAASNSEPQFAAESTTLSVDEDAAIGANVGAAITATDDDGDTLTYAMSGSSAFAIGPSSGQITVQAALDYETQSSYALTVTVTDGKGALGEADATVDDSIAVTVNIGNVDEPGAVTQEPEPPPAITAGPVIVSSPSAGDTYDKGEAIVVAVTFSEAVTVAGEPRMRLRIGERNRWARYDRSEASGTRLIFSYTVKGNDRDEDGVSIEADQLGLNRGSITDADGNAAKLEHPALATQSGHKVDGSPEEQPSQQQQQPATSTVAVDSPIVPDDLGPGDSFRLLFVTSASTTATSTDVADYNGFVQALAAANVNLASFSDQFTAYVSTGAVDARDNTGTIGEGVPIHWLGGEKVAADYADLYDGDWDSVSGMTESGDDYTGLVWTGGNKLGEKSGQKYAGAAEVRMGDLSDVTLALSSPTARAATESYPLYALSPVITVAQPE